MTDKIYRRLIKSLSALSPNISGNPEKSLIMLKKYGLDGFIRKADGDTAELAEIAELLEKRGTRYG